MSKDEINTEAVDRAYGLITGMMDFQRYQKDWLDFHVKAQARIDKAAAKWFSDYQSK